MFFRLQKTLILLVILLAWISRALPSLASEVQQTASGSSSTTRQPTSKPPTDDEMQQQVDTSRSHQDKLQALLQHWKEEFGLKPKSLRVATCSDLTAQQKKVDELGKILSSMVNDLKKGAKDHPQMAEELKSPLLQELVDLLKENRELVIKTDRGKVYLEVRTVEYNLSWLRMFNEEYFLNSEKLSDTRWVEADAKVRQVLKDSSCDPEYLTRATKDVEDIEAQIKVLAAKESTCRASRKCMHDRARAEAVTDSVPNICGDLEDIKLSQQELVRLRSTPSGRTDRYNLDATRERIQLAWAEVAKLKAIFAKETGQQFSARLCSKIPH